MSQPALLQSLESGVATLSLNDAPYNRMTMAFMDELEHAIPKLAADPAVRAVVITARGDEHFSVGMNLKDLASGGLNRARVETILDQRLRVLRSIETMGKPVIATLFGYCLGGGLELPLACHFRLVAAEGAKIGLPELDLGTVPAWGGSARLTRCVGRMHALDMILRGRKIDGPEAWRIGLVNEVVPNTQLKARAQELALELAAQPRLAMAEMLRCVVEAGEQSLADGIVAEREAVLRCLGSAENIEGMAAFMQKRKPNFSATES